MVRFRMENSLKLCKIPIHMAPVRKNTLDDVGRKMKRPPTNLKTPVNSKEKVEYNLQLLLK